MQLDHHTTHIWQMPFHKKQSSREVIHQILLRYLPADTIIFEQNQHGKPYLKNHPLFFNVSHAGDYLLLGLTRNQEIGIDLEYQRDNLHCLDIAKRFFAPSEYAVLAALPESMRQAAFYRCWTLKEAFMKAVGLGLSFGLANFEVNATASIGETTQNQLLRIHQDASAAQQWHLQLLDIPFLPGYVGAIAVAGGLENIEWMAL